MDSAVPPDVWLLLLLGALVVLLWVRARSHRRPMQEIARQLGLSGGTMKRTRLQERFADLSLLQCGHSQRVVDVLSGETEWGALTCFRLINELGSRSTRTVQQWVVAVVETESRIRHVHLAGTAVHTQCLPRQVRALRRADATASDHAAGDAHGAGIYTSAPEAGRLPLQELNAWVARHAQAGQWQITPHFVAGYRAYPRSAEPIQQLVQATLSLCVLLQATASTATTEEQHSGQAAISLEAGG